MRQAIIVIGVFTLILSAAAAHATQYNFIDLTQPGAQYLLPGTLDNTGQVAGSYWPSGSTGYGFTYKSGSYSFPSSPYTTSWQFTRMNNNGVMVGTYEGGVTQSFQKVGTAYTNTVINILYEDPDGGSPGVGPTGTYVKGINDSGVMVGYYGAYNGATASFLLNGPGTYYDYGSLGRNFSLITVPGYSEVQAADINNHGVIIGTVDGTTGFIKNGDVYEIINAPYAGSAGTILTGINNNGQVVGIAAIPVPYAGTDYINFIYDMNTKTFSRIELVNFSGYDPMAWDINDQGQVVGYYYMPGYNYYGFLATPVPLPGSLLLLGSSLLGLVAVGLKRRTGL